VIAQWRKSNGLSGSTVLAPSAEALPGGTEPALLAAGPIAADNKDAFKTTKLNGSPTVFHLDDDTLPAIPARTASPLPAGQAFESAGPIAADTKDAFKTTKLNGSPAVVHLDDDTLPAIPARTASPLPAGQAFELRADDSWIKSDSSEASEAA
jgi:hypothetical protein